MRRVGVGLIGAGQIAEEHARAWATLADRAELRAVADPVEVRASELAARHGVGFACADPRELLRRRDVDLVAICTPPSTHAALAVDALRADRWVICEKPLAHTLEAADAILEAAARCPGRLSVSYQFRYLPDVQRTLWLRDHGRLGALLGGRAFRYARFQRPGKRRAEWWGRWDVAGGGVVITQMTHELDLLLQVFGAVSEVVAMIATRREAIESEDTATATLRFESGALATCDASMSAQRSASGFDVFGELASAHSPWALECADPDRKREALRDALTIHPDAPPDGSRSPTPRPHSAYFLALLDALGAGAPLPIGPEDARASLEVCAAIYASALGREPVSLPLPSGSPGYAGVSAEAYAASRPKPRSAPRQIPRAQARTGRP
jgi:predicted dehydrogenase